MKTRISRVNFCLILITWILASSSNAETEEVRNSLVKFMAALSPGNISSGPNWGWNSSSDPCDDDWEGITCYENTAIVKKVVLDELNLTGAIDAAALCAAASLTVLSLNSNAVAGALTEDISKCSKLTHVYLHGNKLSGSLPVSLTRLKNLKRIDVSSNGFSGGVPDFSRISGLLTFFAQNNQLNGTIPDFDFSNFDDFNVSNNDLAGAIPSGAGRFTASFLNNPRLCGPPSTNSCPPPPPPPLPPTPASKKSSSKKDYFIYSGYALIGVIVILLIAFKLKKKSTPRDRKGVGKKGIQTDGRHEKISGSSSESKAAAGSRSEFSITPESGKNSSSLTVLYSPMVNGLKFEDLLRSPAELISRGRHGSLYKVTVEGGVDLAVKRIRDWEISRDEFKNRMQRINQVRHPNILPIVAFYCSRQEKLLVYHFQDNGSLFNLLHGPQNDRIFDWGSRLNAAAKVAEAVAFMHQGLKADGIPHGNLKSSNVLLSREMDPLISEYGLAEVEAQDQSFLACTDSFQAGGSAPNAALQKDISSFGVLLLELLTGKVVQNNGIELARWVNSAIREEWTVEVFDKAMVLEGASEERMVQLLQLALRCVNSSVDSMGEVVDVIRAIKEEEDEKSGSFD